MKMSMSPKNMDKFRKNPPMSYTLTLKTCAACRVRRSVAQFVAGSDLCPKCVRSGIKGESK